MPAAARLRLLALAGLVALAGCGWVGGMFAGKPKEACPSAVILHPLAQTVLLAPGAGEPRPENVAFYGLLSDVTSECDYTSEGVRVRLDVVIVGQRGPMARGDAIDLNYFVAIVGPGERILGKRPFTVHIAFPGDARRAGVTDHIEELIPASFGRGPELTLDLGFQQPPEAIEFYKHFRGR